MTTDCATPAAPVPGEMARPHLLLDAAGEPAFLTNGVSLTKPGGAAAGLMDWTYTGVFPIRTAAAR